MGVYDPRNVDTLFIGSRGLSKPQIGDVGLFSQSGALGTALLNEVPFWTRIHPSFLAPPASTGFPSSFPSVTRAMWTRRTASTTTRRIPR